MTIKKRLRRKEAAAYLQEQHGMPTTERVLAKYVVFGGGPLYQKCGRFPLYAPEDLDAWVAETLSRPVRSSAELAQSRPARGRAA